VGKWLSGASTRRPDAIRPHPCARLCGR
jgi:hypothetical protein